MEARSETSVFEDPEDGEDILTILFGKHGLPQAYVPAQPRYADSSLRVDDVVAPLFVSEPVNIVLDPPD